VLNQEAEPATTRGFHTLRSARSQENIGSPHESERDLTFYRDKSALQKSTSLQRLRQVVMQSELPPVATRRSSDARDFKEPDNERLKQLDEIKALQARLEKDRVQLERKEVDWRG